MAAAAAAAMLEVQEVSQEVALAFLALLAWVL